MHNSPINRTKPSLHQTWQSILKTYPVFLNTLLEHSLLRENIQKSIKPIAFQEKQPNPKYINY